MIVQSCLTCINNQVMDNLVKQQTNPLMNVFIFGSYCFGGVTMLSYFSFRSFKNVSEKIKIDRPSGQRLNLSKMGSLPGLSKAIVAIGLYFVGFVYLAWDLNLNDRMFQSCIKKDIDYTNKIKLDPFFQDFYILNTMRYFGISDKLIKKTEDELRAKVKEGHETQVQGSLVGFEKSMLMLASKIGGESKLASTK